jgi:APA family basic amino acid/polyamine antiporter
MFPEAGGSSSFARHAFNDSTSFFAGWALSLDYILTIAISAYFVPFYASALPGLGALAHSPGNIIAALVVLAVLVVLNIRGLGESANLNFILALVDLATQGLVVILGAVLVLDPSRLISQVHIGVAPSLHQLVSPTRASKPSRTWRRRRRTPGETFRARSTSC